MGSIPGTKGREWVTEGGREGRAGEEETESMNLACTIMHCKTKSNVIFGLTHTGSIRDTHEKRRALRNLSFPFSNETQFPRICVNIDEIM